VEEAGEDQPIEIGEDEADELGEPKSILNLYDHDGK